MHFYRCYDASCATVKLLENVKPGQHKSMPWITAKSVIGLTQKIYAKKTSTTRPLRHLSSITGQPHHLHSTTSPCKHPSWPCVHMPESFTESHWFNSLYRYVHFNATPGSVNTSPPSGGDELETAGFNLWLVQVWPI